MFPEVKIAKGARARFYQCPRCRRFRSGGPWWCDECSGKASPSPRVATFNAAGVTREIGSLKRRLRRLKRELEPVPSTGRGRRRVAERPKIHGLGGRKNAGP